MIAEALQAEPTGPAPLGTVTVDFPGSASRTQYPATVVPQGWRPVADDNGGDLAVLALAGSVPGDVAPAVLRRCGDPADRRVRAYGHPAGLDGGVWSEGRLLEPGGPSPEWVQFDGIAAPGHGVARGYSGAGVVDDSGAVIGIVVAGHRERDLKVGWMIPTEVITAALPIIARLIPAGAPTGRGLAFAERQRLAAAVYRIPVMRDDASRQLVVDALRPAISGAIARRPSGLLDVYSIIETCLDQPGGLAELLAILKGFSGDSRALSEAETVIHETGLDLESE